MMKAAFLSDRSVVENVFCVIWSEAFGRVEGSLFREIRGHAKSGDMTQIPEIRGHDPNSGLGEFGIVSPRIFILSSEFWILNPFTENLTDKLPFFIIFLLT